MKVCHSVLWHVIKTLASKLTLGNIHSFVDHILEITQQAGYRSFPLVNNFNTVLPAEKDSNNDSSLSSYL